MPLPPWDQVWMQVRQLIGPAFVVSLGVMLVVRCLPLAAGLVLQPGMGTRRLLRRFGELLTPLAAALALAAGTAAGNEQKRPLEWQADPERELTADDMRTVLRWSLESVPPPAEQEDQPSQWFSRHWLGWT